MRCETDEVTSDSAGESEMRQADVEFSAPKRRNGSSSVWAHWWIKSTGPEATSPTDVCLQSTPLCVRGVRGIAVPAGKELDKALFTEDFSASIKRLGNAVRVEHESVPRCGETAAKSVAPIGGPIVLIVDWR